MIKKTVSVLLNLLFSTSVFAYQGEIAITIDDLPFVGSSGYNAKKLEREETRFNSILNTLIENKVPATGFIIANSIEKGQWELLENFRNAGFQLGNHTYSHKSLGNLSAEKYISDVDKADKILTPIMTSPKYFRYPYLAEGNGKKKEAFQQYLKEHNYIVAPVTIDSKDYRFNSQLFAIPYSARPKHLDQLKKRYLDYVWKQTVKAQKMAENSQKPNKQILLIHANLLNSYFLGDLIKLYESNDYHFISLEEALNRT